MYQKEIVLHVLKMNRKWTPSYDLIRVSTPWGWLGSSGDRRSRELRAEGLVESKDFKEHGKSITYFRIKKH
jgi:hypothetical protein